MLRMSPVSKGGGCRLNQGVQRLPFSKTGSSNSSRPLLGLRACYLSGPCARARGGGGGGVNKLCATPRRPSRIQGGESRLSEPSAEEARVEGIKAIAAASAIFVALSIAGHSVPQLDDALRQSRADDDARDANLGISPLTGKRELPPPGRGGAYGMTRFLLDGPITVGRGATVPSARGHQSCRQVPGLRLLAAGGIAPWIYNVGLRSGG